MAVNRVFPPEFRLSLVKRVRKGEKVRLLGQELQIGRSVLYRWCDLYRREGMAGIERGTGRPPQPVHPCHAVLNEVLSHFRCKQNIQEA